VALAGNDAAIDWLRGTTPPTTWFSSGLGRAVRLGEAAAARP